MTFALPAYPQQTPQTAGQASSDRPDSTLVLPGLAAPARLLTDRFGIPHLWAASLGDLYYVWGLVTARDRLAQLEFLRRASQGELSAVIGNRGLKADGGARLLELKAQGVRLWRQVPTDSPAARALQRFCEGVNAWIDLHASARRPWPYELRLLGMRPARWGPEDVMSVVLAQGILLDLYLPQLDRAKGEKPAPPAPPDSLVRFLEGLTYETIPAAAAAALYGGSTPSGDAAPGRPSPPRGAPIRPQGSDRLAHRARLEVERIRAGFAALGLAPGASNAFAVGSARSEKGSGLLANDPHLLLTAPAFWYAVHVTVPDTVDAAGLCVPGTPVLISGRNRELAWGITALSGQAMEIYADTLDKALQKVRWKNEWVPLRRSSFGLSYRVLGLPVPIPGMARRYTPHGPVLALDKKKRLAYSVRWAALEDSVTLGVIGLERSRTFEELRDRLAGLFTPTLNVVVADRSGELLYQVAGALPRRSYAMSAEPTPGGGDHEWSGLLEFSELPSWRPSRQEFVVNGNNRPVGTPYPHFLGYYDWSCERALRMAQRLAADSIMSIETMASVQNDVRSLQAERLTPLLLHHADSLSATLAPAERAALDTLRGWDYRIARGGTAPTLFRAWANLLARNLHLGNYSYAVAAALDGRAPELLSAVQPGARPAQVVVKALRDARQTLTKVLGPDPARWTWERAHRARFAHLLQWKKRDLTPPLLPADGDGTTICVGPSGVPTRSTFAFGPSFRHVVDLAVEDSSWVVVPPGNWEDQQAVHGRDQLVPWQRHAYTPLYLSWPCAESARESEWRLAPAQR